MALVDRTQEQAYAVKTRISSCNGDIGCYGDAISGRVQAAAIPEAATTRTLQRSRRSLPRPVRTTTPSSR